MIKEDVIAIAKMYNTRMEFKKGNQYVYAIAGKLGIRDEACAHMRSGRIKWTKDTVMAEMAKYDTRTDFAIGSSGAYGVACREGWIDEIETVNKTWTKKEVMEEASKYKHRVDFQKGNYAAYGYAYRHGFFDEACAHMTSLTITWTPQLLAEEALKYSTRSEFKMSNNSAYKKAYGFKIMDEICKHMTKITTVSDNDAIYIWKVLDMEDTYKIGTTSSRLGDKRVKDTIGLSGFYGEIIIIAKVSCRATDIENEIHSWGDPIEFTEFEGYTEFRVLNKEALQEAIELITSYS